MATDIEKTTTAHPWVAGRFAGRLWTRAGSLLGEMSRKGGLALFDQGIVSLTRFVTTIMVGRACGADELGVYALAFSVLVLLGVIQESLITAPFTILHHSQSDAERRLHAGSVLVHYCVWAVLVAAALVGCGLVLSAEGGSSPLALLVWTLAATMPSTLLREFARRMAFARLHVGAALALDLAASVIQLGGLFLLAATGTLSAITAFGVIGVACGLPGIVWLIVTHHDFRIDWSLVTSRLGRNWTLGRWMFGSQLLAVATHYSIHWVLMVLIGATATGVYSACFSVVMLANPLVLGLTNILQPKAAQALARGGKRALVGVVRTVTWVLAAFMGAFLLLISLIGETLVAWFYNDPSFADHGHTIIILSSSMAIFALGIGYGHGLKAMERPKWTFYATALDLIVMLLTAVPLGYFFGLVGGAYCLLLGSIVATVTRYLAFRHYIREPLPKAAP
jgi:O-antigen/teichoic acid export membrane protein